MRTLIAATVLACSALAHTDAAPLELKQVAADARWLVHLDVDAMRQSVIVERGYAAGLQRWSIVREWIEGSAREVGVDPTVGLHGITAFGKEPGKLTGVGIVYADMDPEQILARARDAGLTTTQHGSHEVHGWKNGKDTLFGSFYSSGTLVVARTAAAVEHQLDVLDGQAPAMSADSLRLLARYRPGTILSAWGVGLSGSLPWRSAIAKKCESVELVLGEDAGSVFAQMRLGTGSVDAAQKVADVLRGMAATWSLENEGDAAATSVVEKVELKAKGEAVEATFAAPADDVWKAIGRLAARIDRARD